MQYMQYIIKYREREHYIIQSPVASCFSPQRELDELNKSLTNKEKRALVGLKEPVVALEEGRGAGSGERVNNNNNNN